MTRGTKVTSRLVRPMVAGVVVAGLIGLTACSGSTPGGGSGSASGGGSTKVAKQPATAEGLKAAVKAMAEALLKSPASTYDYQTAECRSKMTRADYAAQMIMAQLFLEGLAKVKMSEMHVGEVTVRNVTATTGEGTVELLDATNKPIGDSSSYTTYVYEDGTWLNSECQSSGSSSSGDSGSTGSDTTIGGDLISTNEAAEREHRKASSNAEIGSTAILDGMTILVSSVTFGESFDDPTLSEPYNIKVQVRVENRTGETHNIPELKVVCADGTSGSWSSDGTYSAFSDLGSGTFAEGTLSLGVPRDCVEPLIRAQTTMFTDAALVDWVIPADALRS